MMSRNKIKKLRKRIDFFLIVVLGVICGLFFSISQKGICLGDIEVSAEESTGLNVEYHSQAEIMSYINSHGLAK